MRQMIEQARFEEALKELSRREREVMDLLVLGFSNQEIMDKLSISLPTAKQYKSMVMRKLNLRSLSQLIQLHQQLNSASMAAPA
ncbi:MAG: LuxR family transcriptional regulator [Limnohabitans sp.]|nr:MAG: LuxR family transcriptional regulator [Limnohabitans sp.]